MRAGTSEKLINYVRGAGGRIETLRGFYLDRAAEAVAESDPKNLTCEIQDLLVSGRFRRSRHPRLAGLNVAQLRELRSRENRRMHQRRKDIHGEAEFLAAERARKRAAVVR